MYDGEVVKMIRLLRGFSQHGAGISMGITQQGFAKLKKKGSIPEKKMHAVLKALNSSQKEFDEIKNLLSLPPKNK